MATDSFRIEGSPRADGKVYFTSKDLPGFRLLLDQRDDVQSYFSEIEDALKIFVPLYVAAQARQKHLQVTELSRESRGADAVGLGFELVASMAPHAA